MKELSVYIHIPFCLKKCHYCDFTSFDNSFEKIEEYVNALCDEIKTFDFRNYEIISIFFGGGTPSLLEPKFIEKILKSLCNYNENIEITLECNPETLNINYLKEIKTLGINRLSIGLQSMNNETLKKIGRVHTYSKFLENFKIARKLGFKNINIDVMFSLPDVTLEQYLFELEEIAKLNAEHLSVYSLIVEEDTKLENMLYENLISIPNEEEDRKMFENSEIVLKKYGYKKYEISNYSKDNFECIHNLGYWELRDYIGFGISAHSLIENIRFENTNILKEYINKKNCGINKTILTKNNLMEEFMFLGLRKNTGINILDFYKKFNLDIYHVYGDVIFDLKSKGYLIEEKENLKLSQNAVSISNIILSDFLL